MELRTKSRYARKENRPHCLLDQTQRTPSVQVCGPGQNDNTKLDQFLEFQEKERFISSHNELESLPLDASF